MDATDAAKQKIKSIFVVFTVDDEYLADMPISIHETRIGAERFLANTNHENDENWWIDEWPLNP